MNRHQLGDHVWCVPHGEERLRLPGVVAEIGMAEGRFNGSYVVLLDDGRRYHALGSEVVARVKREGSTAWEMVLGDLLPD